MAVDNRVVITGIGVVSPLGLTGPDTWQAMQEGQTGIDRIQGFDPDGLEVTFAGEVKGFDPLNYMDRKEAKRTDRFVQLAIAATREALAQADLEITDRNADDIGVVIGSGIGGISTFFDGVKTFLEKGPGRVSPFLVPMMIGDMAAGQISIMFGAKGPNFCTQSACASGADGVGTAYEILRRGDAQAMITGGAEAGITPLGIAAFVAARALSSRNDDPQHASRPFDRDRDGFVMAEGSAILILERLDSAVRRGAPILAEVISYGMSADAYHITQPAEGGEGGARAMKMALRKADLQPEQVDYINAHGTSTPFNDRAETQAIKSIFGEHAYQIPISSTKSMTGHLLGAAGAVESAVCVWSIRDGVIPPTINYTTPDPECDLDYVPNQARKAEVNVALTNSFGFGGHNSTLIFRRYEE